MRAAPAPEVRVKSAAYLKQVHICLVKTRAQLPRKRSNSSK
jgi:hypothetical protein